MGLHPTKYITLAVSEDGIISYPHTSSCNGYVEIKK